MRTISINHFFPYSLTDTMTHLHYPPSHPDALSLTHLSPFPLNVLRYKIPVSTVLRASAILRSSSATPFNPFFPLLPPPAFGSLPSPSLPSPLLPLLPPTRRPKPSHPLALALLIGCSPPLML